LSAGWERGHGRVGLADSFNMVIMSFFAAIDLGTTVVVA
jgi:Na+-driven multidrug efflux pump